MAIESTGERLTIEQREAVAVRTCVRRLREIAKTLDTLGRTLESLDVERLADDLELEA